MQMSSPVTLIRRVTFSSGHRYWDNRLSPEQNRERFGKWASPFNHGHNYILDVAVSGPVDPQNGMVVNIKTIDDRLKSYVLSTFDQRSINDEVPGMENLAPNLENLLFWLDSTLSKPGVLPEEVSLDHLRLYEMPTLWADLDRTNKMLTLTRTYEFAASHRLHAPALSHDENLRLFGKCNNPNGHGHNYVLEVTVSGQQDPQTGFITSLEELDKAVHQEVVDRYDHRNLNEDIPEFANRPTTSEIVALEIFARLDGKIPGQLEAVKLFETARNAFEVRRR